MNPVLKLTGGLVLSVLTILVGGGLMMPRTWHVEQSALIEAPPAAIYPALVDLPSWKEWTAWDVGRDAAASWTYTGPEGQVGYTASWDGPEIGQGHLVLTEVSPDAGVRYALYFGDSTSGSQGSIQLSPEADGTRVTWTDDKDLGYNLAFRLMAPRFKYNISQDFALGLFRLKARSEAAAAEAASAAAAAAEAAEAAAAEAAAETTAAEAP